MKMEKEETSSAHTPFVELALIETEIKYRIKLTIENSHTNNLEVHSVFDGLIIYSLQYGDCVNGVILLGTHPWGPAEGPG